MAARQPDSPGVAPLGDILDEAEVALDRDDDPCSRPPNMAFHRGVATCSGNGVLAQVMTLLTDIYSSEQSVMLTISNQRREDHAEHRSILDAIREGEPTERAGACRATSNPCDRPWPHACRSISLNPRRPRLKAHRPATNEEVRAADERRGTRWAQWRTSPVTFP